MHRRGLALKLRVDDLSEYTREELVTHFGTSSFFPLFFGFAFAMDGGEGWGSRGRSLVTCHMSHVKPVGTLDETRHDDPRMSTLEEHAHPLLDIFDRNTCKYRHGERNDDKCGTMNV